MSEPIVDLEMLHSLSGGDPVYIYEVVKLYLDTMPPGLDKLEQSIRKASDYEVVQKQAHFLKSSASIIKVRGMYDRLIDIEILAKQHTGREEMNTKLDEILAAFKEALPLITAERDKCKPKKTRKAKA